MAHRRTCLVASDEEDEDGNLSEGALTSKKKSIPTGEVVYLTEDTSNFQPEEEPHQQQQKTKKEQNVSGQSIKVKTMDSLRRIPDKEPVTASSSSEKASSQGNQVTKSSPLKAADLMPPPLKRSNTNINQNNNFKKAKYARQATPICDAIMKEYSKRQRVIKQKGSPGAVEVSDVPIQELLKKAKNKEGTQVDNKDASSSNDNAQSAELNMPSEEANSDPLTVVKQEIVDVKPKVIYVAVDSVQIKQETNDLPASSPKNNQISRGRGRGRGRPPRGGQQRRRKKQISDEEDDTDEDPDFDPSVENMKTRPATRFSRRRTHINRVTDSHEKDSPDTQEKDASYSHGDNESDTSQNEENQESCAIPKDKVINVAERLKSLADKIADVLTKDPSPNINSEAEKLLHTTQELIEMQKKTLQNSEKRSISVGSIPIKQEIIDTLENSNEISTNSLNKSTMINTSMTSQSSAQNSLHIYNQLQRHEAALQKKLSEGVSSNDQIGNITKTVTPHNFLNTGSGASEPVSVHEKCKFIMDFFTSYQEVFDEYTMNQAIPILSDNILPCVNELNECILRTKKAETLKPIDLKHQEITLAKQSYLSTIMSSGNKFFPWFKYLIERITKTSTPKALINTLMVYILGSLFLKDPKLTNHRHRLRRVLLFLTKAHQYYHSLVIQVLRAPNNDFDGESKLIRHMLKYFHARNFLKIPAELLCNYSDDTLEEAQQFQAELSVMDTAILKHVSDVDCPVKSTVNQNYSKQLGIPSTSASSVKNQSRFSHITAELEVLRNERDGNTKRIEQKLDYLLNVLSGNGEYLGNSLNVPQKNPIRPQVKLEKEGINSIQNLNVRVNLGKRVPNVPTVKLTAYSSQQISTELTVSSATVRNNQPASLPEDKGVLLAQLFENDNTGLDSLFSSYLKSRKDETTVRIKSEAIDIAESTNEIAQQILFPVKQEPSDIFFDEQGERQPNASNVHESLLEDAIFDDSFTEEYNFTKTEQDFLDVDPFS